jgi:hypothetical protein
VYRITRDEEGQPAAAPAAVRPPAAAPALKGT